MLDLPFRSLATHLPNVLERTESASPQAEVLSQSDAPPGPDAEVGFCPLQFDDALARSSLMVEDALAFASVQVKAARAAWSTECQDRLCQEAAVAWRKFERHVSASLVSVLTPFIDQWQRERVLQSLLRVVGQILDEAPCGTVTIIGPTPETEIVACSLGKRAISVVPRSGDRARLEVTIGPTTVRADFSRWHEAFSAAIVEGLDDVDGTGTDS